MSLQYLCTESLCHRDQVKRRRKYKNTRDPELNQSLKDITGCFIKDLIPGERFLLDAANLTETVLQDAIELDRGNKAKGSNCKVA